MPMTDQSGGRVVMVGNRPLITEAQAKPKPPKPPKPKDALRFDSALVGFDSDAARFDQG